MKKLYWLASLMIIVGMICSCAGGGGGNGADSADVPRSVAVSMHVTSSDSGLQRAISASETDLSGVTFWYRAIPQFTSEFGNVQGDTRYDLSKDDNNFVQIVGMEKASPEKANVNWFAMGLWKFEIEVRLADAVIYKTQSAVSKFIDPSSVNLEFNVEKNYTTNSTGTIEFDIFGLNMNTGKEFMSVKYGKVGEPQTNLIFADGSNKLTVGAYDKDNDTMIPFSGSKSGIPAGMYVISVIYSTGEGQNVSDIGASTVVIDLLEDQTITINGDIQSGDWKSMAFKINGIYKLGIQVAVDTRDAQDNVVNPVVGQSTVFKATIVEDKTNLTNGQRNSLVYEWYYMGSMVGTGSSYTLPAKAQPGYNYIDCIAYYVRDGKTQIATRGTLPFTIQPAQN